jgi:UDP-N-acetylmuramoyl-L-alanyl-D-glutamate--2,6-diaminopimelate ligase
VPFSAIEAGVSNLENVPGRFQVVSEAADEVRVIVDYAHTDDALKNLLETARRWRPAGWSPSSAAAAIAIAPSGR